MSLVAMQLNVANLGISAWDGDSGCLRFLPSSHWWSSSDLEVLHWKQKEEMLNLPYIHIKCRINAVYDKNRNHCGILSFRTTIFAYSVRFGLLADIYLLYSVFPTTAWPSGDVLYEGLCWHVVAACNMFCHGNLLKDTKSIRRTPTRKNTTAYICIPLCTLPAADQHCQA